MALNISDVKPVFDADGHEWIRVKINGTADFQLCVGSARSNDFMVRSGYVMRAMERIQEKYDQTGAMLSKEDAERLAGLESEYNAVISSVLVTDWKEVNDADGNKMDYEPSVLRNLINDIPTVRQDIISAAWHVAMRLTGRKEETAEK